MSSRCDVERGVALAVLYKEIAGLEDQVPGSVPCLGPNGDAWTSEEQAIRRWAAEQCWACPALAACAAYTEQYPEPGAVWAGK